MEYTTDMIIEKLKGYTQNKRKLLLLEYELRNLALISPSEALETMAYGNCMGEKVSGGTASSQDRILHIALAYRDCADRQGTEAYREVVDEWQSLYAEVNRLETYLSLLHVQHHQILRCVYFEEKTWREIEAEAGLSRRTINRRKKDAVEALVEMYSYTKRLTER